MSLISGVQNKLSPFVTDSPAAVQINASADETGGREGQMSETGRAPLLNCERKEQLVAEKYV